MTYTSLRNIANELEPIGEVLHRNFVEASGLFIQSKARKADLLTVEGLKKQFIDICAKTVEYCEVSMSVLNNLFEIYWKDMAELIKKMEVETEKNRANIKIVTEFKKKVCPNEIEKVEYSKAFAEMREEPKNFEIVKAELENFHDDLERAKNCLSVMSKRFETQLQETDDLATFYE